MRIIQPSVEIMRTGLETEFVLPEQFIEKVGRTCYKSEDKITKDSAAKFVGNLIKRGHEAMIEHWSLIFRTDCDTYDQFLCDWESLLGDPLYKTNDRLRPHIRFASTLAHDGEVRNIISGNMRAWRDFVKAQVECLGRVSEYLYGMIRCYPLFFPEYQDYVPGIFVNDKMIPISVNELLDPERIVHQDVTVKFICDRGVSHEIVRHRAGSYAQESTRYCNYGLDKFDKCVTVVEPLFLQDAYAAGRSDIIHAWERACANAEAEYFNLLDAGCTPQEARAVLPNSLKTEVIVTMTLDGWEHFFGLRCALSAHPDMRVIALKARHVFNEAVYGKNDEADNQ